MTTRPDDGLEAACSLGQHQHCTGNIDLLAGPGPAVPLLRCSCRCHRGRVRTNRTWQAKDGAHNLPGRQM
ncbi:hypothetical protein ACF061_00435 [Streptomyces sp. NPDC015220]|uniref:hypothetical protein n=1 Tax=Streptomyces sp. NPDC015220 TaxID=3364947 RepID=UPI0036FBD184